MLSSILAAAAIMLAAQTPTTGTTTMHARGTFDVTITPVKPEPGTAADVPGRMTLSKVFHGALAGT